ncbi:MAG: hypothetical protein AAF293_14130 [Pseudomonadota bacterium]
MTSAVLIEEGGTFRVYVRNTYRGYRNAYIQAVTQEYLNKVIANSGSADMDVDHYHAKKSVKDNMDAIEDMDEDGEDLADPHGFVLILVGAASASLNRSYGAKDDVETLIKKTAGLPMDASSEKVGDALNAIMGRADDAGEGALKAGYVIPKDGVERANVTSVTAAADLTPTEKKIYGAVF